MRAAVEKDTTIREIVIKVVDGPVLDVSESWHRRPRRIRVDGIRISIVDGETHTLSAFGGLVLKNGGVNPDGQRDKRVWMAAGGYRTPIDTAPDWARRIWNEAPDGIDHWKIDSEEGTGNGPVQ